LTSKSSRGATASTVSLRSGGVTSTTLVIGSTPSVSTSESCSTQVMIAFNSSARPSVASSATSMRASLATRSTVALSIAMCQVIQRCKFVIKNAAASPFTSSVSSPWARERRRT